MRSEAAERYVRAEVVADKVNRSWEAVQNGNQSLYDHLQFIANLFDGNAEFARTVQVNEEDMQRWRERSTGS
jgi:hypothetical protein